jgi:hypothetical protein
MKGAGDTDKAMSKGTIDVTIGFLLERGAAPAATGRLARDRFDAAGPRTRAKRANAAPAVVTAAVDRVTADLLELPAGRLAEAPAAAASRPGMHREREVTCGNCGY